MTLNVGGVSRATSPNLGDSKGLTLNRPCTRGRAVIDDRQGSAEFPEPEVEPRSEGDADVARRRNRRRQSLASGHLRSEAPATPSELSRASVTTAITERVIHGSCRSAGVTMGPARSRATNSVAANGDAGKQGRIQVRARWPKSLVAQGTRTSRAPLRTPGPEAMPTVQGPAIDGPPEDARFVRVPAMIGPAWVDTPSASCRIR